MIAHWHHTGRLPRICTISVLLPLWLWLHSTVVVATFQEKRDLPHLSPDQLQALVSSQDASKAFDLTDAKSHLSKILIPRAPESDNHTLVRQHITSTLKNLRWDIEEDTFTDNTPYGSKQFTNIIATKDPDAPRRVVLAAHYDSKFFDTYPLNQFVGATDSAMPCALMLDLAEALNPYLDARKTLEDSGLNMEEDEAAEVTLQLIFFDGEEAFKDWTSTDSIYGARHLADLWEAEYVSPHPARRLSQAHTRISTIDHLILLDLLGAPKPQIMSYFVTTAWLFDHLIDVEARLAAAGVARTDQSFFRARTGPQVNVGGIGDDHVPFIQRGVSILHIIAYPFPKVWHTLGDDATALDMPTMRKWNLIFRVFMAEYLGLRPDNKRSSRDNGDLLADSSYNSDGCTFPNTHCEVWYRVVNEISANKA